jgi:hypothetical protein
MFDRVSGVVLKAVGAALCVMTVVGCTGGGGSSAPVTPAPTAVTQSNITLPSSVQVVSAK